jgi:hypothetical protein
MQDPSSAESERAAEALRDAIAKKTFSMPDDQFVEFLFKRVAADAENRMLAREHQRWTTMALVIPFIVAVIGVIGYSSISDLRETITERVQADINKRLDTGDLQPQIEQAVNAVLKDKITELNNSVALARLSNLAGQVRQKNSLPKRTALLDLLNRFSTDERVKTEPDFIAALAESLDAFWQADFDKGVDEIDTLYRTIVSGNKGMMDTITTIFSERMFGDADVDSQTRERFLYYAKQYKDLDPAYAYLYLLAYEHHFGGAGKDERIAAYLEDINRWGSGDKAKFYDVMESAVTGEDKTGRMQRETKRYSEFIDARWSEIEPVLQDETNGEAEHASSAPEEQAEPQQLARPTPTEATAPPTAASAQ